MKQAIRSGFLVLSGIGLISSNSLAAGSGLTKIEQHFADGYAGAYSVQANCEVEELKAGKSVVVTTKNNRLVFMAYSETSKTNFELPLKTEQVKIPGKVDLTANRLLIDEYIDLKVPRSKVPQTVVSETQIEIQNDSLIYQKVTLKNRRPLSAARVCQLQKDSRHLSYVKSSRDPALASLFDLKSALNFKPFTVGQFEMFSGQYEFKNAILGEEGMKQFLISELIPATVTSLRVQVSLIDSNRFLREFELTFNDIYQELSNKETDTVDWAHFALLRDATIKNLSEADSNYRAYRLIWRTENSGGTAIAFWHELSGDVIVLGTKSLN